MAGQTTNCFVGVQDNDEDAYRGDPVSATIRKQE